jgi:hypothetical protein
VAFAAAAVAAPAPDHSAAPPAAAQPAAPQARRAGMPAAANLQPVQVLLTADLVERFIASYPPLEALADQLDQRHPAAASGGDDAEEEGPEYLLADHLADPADAEAINQALAKYGFASYVEWANVAHSVSIAADAADSPPPDLDAQKKQALASLDADKSLSPEEKKAQRDEIDNQFAALTEFVPLPGNVAVVKPFLSRIRALDADSGD